MDSWIVALTLVAALLHATWNAIAHGITDRLVGFGLIGAAYTGVGAVGALVLGPPPAASWAFVIASATLHVAYTVLLLTSYQLGELSQVYPLARGTSPWVVAVIATTVLGRRLPVSELLGVLIISAGLMILVFLGRPSRTRLPALVAAFATGLCIAAYTTVDGLGVAHGEVAAYASWMFLLQGPALPTIALLRRGRAIGVQMRPVAVVGLLGGLVSLAAYGLVLVAQTSGALAPVAALRETSIVIGALIGATVFGERLGRERAVASAVVVVGIVLLALA